MKKEVVLIALFSAIFCGFYFKPIGADSISGSGGLASFHSGLDLRNGDVWVITATNIDYSKLTDSAGSGKEAFQMVVREWDNDLANWASIGIQVHKENSDIAFQLFYDVHPHASQIVVRTHKIPDGIHMNWPFTKSFDMRLVLQYKDGMFTVSAYFLVEGDNHWTLFFDCQVDGPASVAIPDGLLNNANIEIQISEESDGIVFFEPPVIGFSFSAQVSNVGKEIAIWTDRGCPSTYMVGDPVIVYFQTPEDSGYEVMYTYGEGWDILAEGKGDGNIHSVEITVETPRRITFRLFCKYYFTANPSLRFLPECTIFVEEYCECSDQCFDNELWSMKRFNGICVQDHIVEKDSRQCGYNPCAEADCGDICNGHDLWAQKCVNGNCVDDHLIEADSVTCGYDPCANHCNNGVQDCGEYSIDCGGGCPFIDSDADGIEDCKDACPNSRCDRVDINGCETDVDNDGLLDCDDDCPSQPGAKENNGCPQQEFCIGSTLLTIFVLMELFVSLVKSK